MKPIADAGVLIAGLGNIGSPLASLVGRLGVGRLILVDRDHVEDKNVRAQDFRPEDVGRPKADVLAARLRPQLPGCRIESVVCDLEDLPLGVARVDLILGALDSRRARQLLISETAWPLGVPVIDGGVGDGRKGRVQVFAAREASACLECTWGEQDYRNLSLQNPCTPGGSVVAPPTNAPAFLGASVAAMMTAEAAIILENGPPTESHEIAFDLTHRRQLVSRLRRNPRCLFGHEIVQRSIEVAPDTSARELLRTIAEHADAFHLEARLGLLPGEGFASGRLLSRDRLAAAGEASLASLGFDVRDLIRVRSPSGSIFVRFQS